VAQKLGIDLVWFGVLLAVNMQTSFLHPPFGFALFYLRSVAPNDDYKDRVTGRSIAKVTTGQIYWGAVPFVIIQIVMVGLIIAFPGIVSRDLNKAAEGNIDQLQQDVDRSKSEEAAAQQAAEAAQGPASAASGSDPAASAATAEDDPMKALEDSMKKDAAPDKK
jgi:hypothetical protein